MAKVTVEAGIYDATVEVSGLLEVDEGVSVRILVRTGRKSGTGNKVFDESYTVFGTLVSDTVYDLEPETWYTANASLDGGGTWIGAAEFQTDPEEVEWPGDWEWWTDKEQGEEVYIEAEEWNEFCKRIDEIRVYAGVGEYGFAKVDSGDSISATTCMAAYIAIDEIADSDDMPDPPFKGFPMMASFFNDLRDALNAVE